MTEKHFGNIEKAMGGNQPNGHLPFPSFLPTIELFRRKHVVASGAAAPRSNLHPSAQEVKMTDESKRKSGHRGNIKVGDITNAKGVAVGHGASATVTEGVSGEEVTKLFQSLSQRVAALPEGPSKEIAQQAVTGLEQEVKKGEAAQEQNVSTWFNFLAQAAPDVWDVAVAALANPIAGVAKVVQLVAKKAKEEKEAKK